MKAAMVVEQIKPKRRGFLGARPDSTSDPDEGQGLTVRFHGVRGSYPVSNAAFLRFGGNTPCVELSMGRQILLIDAGSGLSAAGERWEASPPDRVDILLSHLHHDHISALPFFAPAMMAGCEIHLWCGHLDGASAQGPIETMFAPPLFPIRLERLPARLVHHGFRAGRPIVVGGIEIATCPLAHPGGATGYRFDYRGRRLCYLSDLEHAGAEPDPDLVGFCRDADLVIYDSMYSESEYRACQGWGHSTWQAGVELCRVAGARAMAGFHHNPLHDDARLAAMEADLQAVSPASFFARDGQVMSFAPVAAEREPAR